MHFLGHFMATETFLHLYRAKLCMLKQLIYVETPQGFGFKEHIKGHRSAFETWVFMKSGMF